MMMWHSCIHDSIIISLFKQVVLRFCQAKLCNQMQEPFLLRWASSLILE